MKLAAYQYEGHRHVGQVSDDGTMLTRIGLPQVDTTLDMQALIERYPSGKLAELSLGEAVPLEAVELLAPISLPRRNIWCVGRNYHAHAKELSESVFRAAGSKVDEWPIVFTKVP